MLLHGCVCFVADVLLHRAYSNK